MTTYPTEINKIFWGLLIILADVNIVFFDLFPDFVGYFLIVSALGNLQALSTAFQKAKLFAIVLGMISIVTWFLPDRPLSGGLQPSTDTWLAVTSSTGIIALHIVLIYFVLSGLSEMANQLRLTSITEKANRISLVYVVAGFVSVSLLPFMFNVTIQTASFIVVTTAILFLIIEITVLVFLRTVRRSMLSIDLNANFQAPDPPRELS